eukprot:1927476-Alexandrium_andersonii.AAC.1
MLGTTSVPRLKAKAAETRHLLPICPMICRENARLLGPKGALWLAASEALIGAHNVMEAEPRNMSTAGLEQLRGHTLRFLRLWKASGGHLVFKHHCMWHLAERAKLHGNPKFYWTYADEGENRVMSA